MVDPALESLLVSTGVIALAEIGDKTQLLSLMLAARYKRPAPIIAGILIATLANHLQNSAPIENESQHDSRKSFAAPELNKK